MKLTWKKVPVGGYVAFTRHGMYVEQPDGRVTYNAASPRSVFFAVVPGGRAGALEHHEKASKK